jgi:hypothetical protein
LSYYPDLSPYAYAYKTSEVALNVGWLSGQHPYPTGPTPDGLVKRLLKHARKPVQLTRGRHVCELCGERRETIRMQSGLRPVWLGNGEIRVTGEHDTVYAAPTMIAHYVAEHDYLPPKVFVDAVLRS